MSKNVLSIDFTYFQKATIEALRSYPEDIDKETYLSTLLWACHYLDAVQGVLTRSVSIMGEEFMRLERILQAQPKDCPVLIANSQVHVYNFIHAHIPTNHHINLYNLDMYHDLLDGKTVLNCRNWVMRVFSEYRMNFHWVANPVSLELHGFDTEEKMQDSLSKVVMPNLKQLEEIYAGGRTFDAIFLCRSDMQSPPHLDRYFAQLCNTIKGHFKRVEMEQGIDKCRNYWQYIGELEDVQKRAKSKRNKKK